MVVHPQLSISQWFRMSVIPKMNYVKESKLINWHYLITNYQNLCKRDFYRLITYYCVYLSMNNSVAGKTCWSILLCPWIKSRVRTFFFVHDLLQAQSLNYWFARYLRTYFDRYVGMVRSQGIRRQGNIVSLCDVTHTRGHRHFQPSSVRTPTFEM